MLTPPARGLNDFARVELSRPDWSIPMLTNMTESEARGALDAARDDADEAWEAHKRNPTQDSYFAHLYAQNAVEWAERELDAVLDDR